MTPQQIIELLEKRIAEQEEILERVSGSYIVRAIVNELCNILQEIKG